MSYQREAKAKVLVDKVCEYVNVMERDYFSCTYNTAEGKVSVSLYCVQHISVLGYFAV